MHHLAAEVHLEVQPHLEEVHPGEAHHAEALLVEGGSMMTSAEGHQDPGEMQVPHQKEKDQKHQAMTATDVDYQDKKFLDRTNTAAEMER